MTAAELREFWTQRPWPEIDPPGFTFMGRAIDQIGRSMFGEDWTGTEPAEQALPPRKKIMGDVPDQLRDMISKRYRDNEAALERWSRVRLSLLSALLDGSLGSFMRWGNGTMRPAKTTEWNRSEASALLAACCIISVGEWSSVHLSAFVVTDHLDTLAAGREPTGRPDWWPTDGDTAKSWVTGQSAVAVLAEARRRSRLVAIAPGRNDYCKGLTVMWAEAKGREISWKTFQQYLIADGR